MEHGTVITGGLAVSRTVDHLPKYYTEVTPVASTAFGSAVPATSVTSLKRDNIAEHWEKEYEWLENLRSVLEAGDVTTDGIYQKTSWGCIPCQPPGARSDYHHINFTASSGPRECTHGHNAEALHGCGQISHSALQPGLRACCGL